MGHFKGSAAGRPLRKPHSNQGSPARYRVWAPGPQGRGTWKPAISGRRSSVPYFNGLPNAGRDLPVAVFPVVPKVVNTLATGLD